MPRSASIAGILVIVAALIMRLAVVHAAPADLGWREYADPASGTRDTISRGSEMPQ